MAGNNQPGPGPANQQKTDDLFKNLEKLVAVPKSTDPMPEPMPMQNSVINYDDAPAVSPSHPGSGGGSGSGTGNGPEDASDHSTTIGGLGRQAILTRIQQAAARLNELTNNHHPCGCPLTCPGPVHGAQA